MAPGFETEPNTAPVSTTANPHARGVNNAHRVENIVAAQHLSRGALLASGLPPLVPAVYAWAPYRPEIEGEGGLGWMLDEFRTGEELIGVFPRLPLDEKRKLVTELAQTFSCIQAVKLPLDVKKFGGLTFDEHGRIVDGQMPTLDGGPWETYAEVWQARLRAQLKNSEKEGLVLLGWRPDGVRDRIEAFLANGGVERVLDSVDVKQRVLVHGDFTSWNVLFESESARITALLDFDFASVTHPCHEFFGGFSDIGGGIRFEDKGCQFLAQPVLSGNFGQVPEGLSEEQLDKWEVAKAWDAALATRGAIRPSSIAGLDRLEDLRVMADMICPRMLSHEMMLKRAPRDVQEKQRQEIQVKLLRLLEKYGF
ncbi:Aminoglycoside phosphotransferase [Niveomyces insectorum RCEF 264]|uniref:Aminoglycoside phosphotransferase n=1 Tax=Niveomyces insectorum RCEF 264 TaxID=1081102 RepID=A0A167WUU0_9HYPO|nr:Aminoglycoside phosphotransferase [Niveomyces insectorum RCEF 264]